MEKIGKIDKTKKAGGTRTRASTKAASSKRGKRTAPSTRRDAARRRASAAKATGAAAPHAKPQREIRKAKSRRELSRTQKSVVSVLLPKPIRSAPKIEKTSAAAPPEETLQERLMTITSERDTLRARLDRANEIISGFYAKSDEDKREASYWEARARKSEANTNNVHEYTARYDMNAEIHSLNRALHEEKARVATAEKRALDAERRAILAEERAEASDKRMAVILSGLGQIASEAEDLILSAKQVELNLPMRAQDADHAPTAVASTDESRSNADLSDLPFPGGLVSELANLSDLPVRDFTSAAVAQA